MAYYEPKSDNHWSAPAVWKIGSAQTNTPVYAEPIFLGGLFDAYSTSNLSKSGPPAAVVDVIRTALNAEVTGRLTGNVTVLKVEKLPVGGKATVPTLVPLTVMLHGRLAALPLA